MDSPSAPMIGLDAFSSNRPQLPRDSRGSLEVFEPKARPKSKIQELSKQSGVRDDNIDKMTKATPGADNGRTISALDLSDFDPRAQNSSSRATKSLTENSAAERAASWGLVLKSEPGTGKIEGVRVRTSEESQRTSKRNSEDSNADSDIMAGPRIPRVSKDLRDALSSFQQTFVVADATKPDYPILYASAGFFNMTGYSAKEVVGRNCRFLQGSHTDPADVSKIRETLSQGNTFCGRLLNYKKDGTPFWNLLTLAPIKDENGEILKYIGMQVEVSKFTEGTKEKAVRPNGLPESLIKYDARQKDKVAGSVFELVDAVRRPLSMQEAPTVNGGTEAEAGRRLSGGPKLTDVPEASPIAEGGNRKRRRSSSLLSRLKLSGKPSTSKPKQAGAFTEQLRTTDVEVPEKIDDIDRLKELRRGIDLATTLERIEKNFVITDPRLPDNPIIFASDSFLELTEYSREEILGKNCRFLQGADTNTETVREIRDAIREERNITVQLLNYTKSGKPFWNLFHLQPMRDNHGDVQYFIGVQLDGSEHLDRERRRLPETIEKQGVEVIQSAAVNIDDAVRELPDANLAIKDLWTRYTSNVLPKPHKFNSASWAAIKKALKKDGSLSLQHFRLVKELGYGDTGSVHLVQLCGTKHYFAMKSMDKSLMLNRNKVHRTFAERDILDMMDHPFLPTLYGSFQTNAHVCLITDFCPGGELFFLLDKQPTKSFHEETARFFAAEVVVALEYLHYRGVVYRDLKPENILIQSNGHLLLTDFDLSFMSTTRPQLITPVKTDEKHKRPKESQLPTFVAEPVARSNSFVGTEEYIAPEIIGGAGHNSAVDWWALGILLYEMLYGWTPFRGKNRQKTFWNISNKEVAFPVGTTPVSLAARQLIHELLCKDPDRRLGSSSGANELKQHPFFRGIYWPLIRCSDPEKLEMSIRAEINNLEGCDAVKSFDDVF